MNELYDLLVQLMNDHWAKIVTAGIFGAAGWFFGRRRAKRDWQRREFYDRLNVSLNIIRDGQLLLRTLLEKRCIDVFLNAAAADAVIDAGRKTTAEDPLLQLPNDDYWYYLNAILNEISEQFAPGVLKQDLGAPVVCDEYVLCLTCEAAGHLRMRKIRALLIRKSTLQQLPEEQPQVASPHHVTRWETLKILSKKYAETPERFLTMEICV
jgi:hypothetical protein